MDIKKSNIKKKILSMVVIAIILPLVSLILFTWLYQKEILEQKRYDEIVIHEKYSSEMLAERLNSVIDISKDITYENIIENIVDPYAKSEQRITETYRLITNELKNNFYFHKEILFSAVILDSNPNQIYSVTAGGSYRIQSFTDNLKAKLSSITDSLGSDIAFFSFRDSFYIIRNLLSTKNYDHFGILINEVSIEYLFKEFLENDYFREYVEFDINGTIINFDYLEENPLEKARGESFTISSEIKMNDFILKSDMQIPLQEVLTEERLFVLTILIVFLVMLVLLSILFSAFYKSITRPLGQLTNAFIQMEQGELGITIPYAEKGELAFLIKGFNDMSVSTDFLVNKIYKEELKFKEAKISALQAQINPHFINNTLEIINWKAQLLGSSEISKMLRHLSIIMCAQTNRGSNKMIKLREELQYVDSYFYILECRFEDRLQIIKRIDEKLLDTKIPLLIIQPLLENAIVHGIEPAKGGVIEIEVKKENNKIIIAIINDGKKLSSEEEILIHDLLNGEKIATNSVGICNVNERIQLIYGNSYGLSVYKNEEDQTVAAITIPPE